METEAKAPGAGAPAVVRPTGQITGEEAAALKDRVRAMLLAGEDVILDMSEVVFTDSEGLSALVAVYRTACTEARRLFLTNLRTNLRALLELTRLHRVFDVCDDVEAARAAIRATAPR